MSVHEERFRNMKMAVDHRYNYQQELNFVPDDSWPTSKLLRKLAWGYERFELLTECRDSEMISDETFEMAYECLYNVMDDVTRVLNRRDW